MNVLSVSKFAPIDERHELNLYRGNVMQISFDARSGYSLPRWMQVVTAVAALTVAQVAAAAVDISGTPATTAIIGSTYSFTPNVTGARYYRFYISNKPIWASFDTSTGRLSGKPASTNAGITSGIRITARGNRGYDSLPTFSITVAKSTTTTPTNTAPTISGTPATTVVAGAAYSFTPKAADADGDTISFSIANKPTWATFSIATGALTGTPAAANVGTTSGVVISASDGKASTKLAAFNVSVTAASGGTTNHAPTITGSPVTSVTAGSSYSFTPSAADADGNNLTFAITNKPSWATFSTTTGALTGTPTTSNVGATAGIGISVNDGTVTTSLAPFTLTVNAVASPPVTTGSPHVLYLDQIAGPVTGGENNNGTYLSIFGKNFGSDLSKVRVYIGSAEVAAYRAIGVSKGRNDIQQIVVQPGAGVGSGKLPVKVVVNGVASNTDSTFQVNPGDILFVSQSGNDSTAVKNDPAHPYRHLQTSSSELSAAVGAAKPGDVIVLRGGTWTDSAVDGAFVRFWKTGGTAPTGTKGTGYMTVTGYPGETVNIQAPSGGGVQGGGEEAQQAKYLVFSNLTIAGAKSASSDGAPMNSQVHGDFWRIVNNDISWQGVSGTMLAGGVVGRFTSGKILGNHIHHIDGGYMNHGVYLDTATTNAELAYNEINNVSAGNLVQTYDSAGGDAITNLDIHHNSIHDGGRYGLNFSDGTRSVHAWNNLVYNTAYPGIRLSVNDTSLSFVIEHNTLYNVCNNHPQEPGAMYNDYNAAGGTVAVRYNIFLKGSGGCSSAYSSSSTDTAVKFSRNLYSGYSASSKDSLAMSSDPKVTNAAGGDFSLQSVSPAIDAASGSTVTDDFSEKARSLPDIGALEK